MNKTKNVIKAEKDLKKLINKGIENLKNAKNLKNKFPKCIICKQTIGIDFEDDIIYDGIKEIISVGYGSQFDGERLEITICDDCIKKKNLIYKQPEDYPVSITLLKSQWKYILANFGSHYMLTGNDDMKKIHDLLVSQFQKTENI